MCFNYSTKNQNTNFELPREYFHHRSLKDFTELFIFLLKPVQGHWAVPGSTPSLCWFLHSHLSKNCCELTELPHHNYHSPGLKHKNSESQPGPLGICHLVTPEQIREQVRTKTEGHWIRVIGVVRWDQRARRALWKREHLN